jgi:hypothetical protein
VSALSNPEVGKYLNRHFVSAFQKVATFQIVGGQKQGGNVASYFCTPDGLVLHAVAGPVNGPRFLREIRWANETYDLARLENQQTADQLRRFFGQAHRQRLQKEHHLIVPADGLPAPSAMTTAALTQLLDHNAQLHLDNQGKVQLLLAVAPLPRLDQTYKVVFEKILNEKISTNPVAVAGR